MSVIINFNGEPVGKILEDGSVNLELVKLQRLLGAHFQPSGPWELGWDAAVALIALKNHGHQPPKTWRQRLKDWL